MKDDDSTKQLTEPQSAPGIVAPSSRINVAFPFSNIHVESRTQDFDELAAVVSELVAIVEATAPSAKVRELRERTEALVARRE